MGLWTRTGIKEVSRGQGSKKERASKSVGFGKALPDRSKYLQTPLKSRAFLSSSFSGGCWLSLGDIIKTLGARKATLRLPRVW